jgi:diguanylate cyclase (GGDEF)-like protein
MLISKLKKALISLMVLLISLHVSADSEAQRYTVAIEADDIVTKALFNAISNELGIDIQYVRYPDFDTLLDAVKKGDSDFAANITHTQERAKTLSFSKPTNIEYTFLYTVQEISWQDIESIAVPKNTVFKSLIETNFPDIDIREFSGFLEAQQLLDMGDVDGVIDVINQLKPMLEAGFVAELLNDTLSIKPVSIVTKIGENEQLLHAMTDIVHHPLIQKKLRQTVENYQFAIRQAALRKYASNSGIDLNETITFKLENLSPFVSYQQGTRPYGVTADTIFISCGILNLNCEVASQGDETWSEIYADFRLGRIDAIAPLAISEHRKAFTHYSTPHYFPEAILAKRTDYNNNVYRNVSELIVERVGVIKDDFFDELMQILLPQKELYRFDTQQQLTDALVNGDVDYIAIDRSRLNELLIRDSSLNITEDEYLKPFYRSSIAIGFNKDQRGETLAYLFSQAGRMIDMQKLTRRYDSVPNWRTTLATEKEYALKFQRFLSAIILFFAVMSWVMLHLAVTDNLTKLRNRRALQIRHKNGLRPNEFLLYLDLNGFKQINDMYGHNVGDKVLQHYGELIRKICKGRSYRIGGDEFIIVGDKAKHDLHSLISQLKGFNLYLKERDISFDVTASIGVFLSEVEHDNLQDILFFTDMAMYSAKKSDKQQHVIVDTQFVKSFNPKLYSETKDRRYTSTLKP